MADEGSGSGLSRKDLEDVIFRSPSVRRYTQDSPILPDVWFRFGQAGPSDRADLLIVPYRTETVTTGDIASILRPHLPEAAGLAYHQSATAARLTFEELVRYVLPLGPWRSEFWADAEGWQKIPRLKEEQLPHLAAALMAFERGRLERTGPEEKTANPTSPLVLWTLRLVGTIQLGHLRRDKVLRDETGQIKVPLDRDAARAIIEAAAPLIDPDGPRKRMVYSVSLNRDADVSVYRSIPSVKADAAHRLFDIDATGLRWAIVDSGIDAEHPAFRKRRKDSPSPIPPMEKDPFGPAGENNTRIIATYDFTPVRDLLDVNMLRSRSVPKVNFQGNMQLVRGLIRTLEAGLPVSWPAFAPLLRIPHVAGGKYRPPKNEHGTHVAAILAGDWRKSDSPELTGTARPDYDLIGVCPSLELYDLRVLDDNGRGDEFAVMAALQFIRALNTQSDFLAVHGVNLSMSIKHDVANYACGRTPICDEATRLVTNGATVVAAAGNEGYVRNPSQAFDYDEGYRSISITDPGNAEDVITVGATHGLRPLTYGVSYFSSRGPTGDGRRKPDVVAPGEKIWSAVPRGGVRTMDGTSMAAPHVSGCAALLMARHRELIGDPVRVKRVLCASATDLGREPYFQGHGLVDVLRAIQSM